MSAMDNLVVHCFLQRRPAQETCRQVDTVPRRMALKAPYARQHASPKKRGGRTH